MKYQTHTHTFVKVEGDKKLYSCEIIYQIKGLHLHPLSYGPEFINRTLAEFHSFHIKFSPFNQFSGNHMQRKLFHVKRSCSGKHSGPVQSN